MKVELESVPKVITGFRIFLLVQAGVCAFLLDFQQGAILSAVVYLAFSGAMRILSVRIKFVSMLTGISTADLRGAVEQHKAQTQVQPGGDLAQPAPSQTTKSGVKKP